MGKINRVFLIVLDSVGIGGASDAKLFGDDNPNTLKTIAASKNFHTPNLARLGLFNIDGMEKQLGMRNAQCEIKTETITHSALRITHCPPVAFIEFDISDLGSVDKIIRQAEENISRGQTTTIYTSRKVLDLGDSEKNLAASVKISDALTSIVKNLNVRPKFLIAKGGITSSDIGTKGLSVKKAFVLGQVAAGVPVWKIGAESKFPGMSYIIFPGNVGDVDTLRKIVEILSA